jgi:hypothetical protein
MSSSTGDSNPWSLGYGGARRNWRRADATDAAIAKLGTPVVRANELDERFAASRSLGRIGSVGENSKQAVAIAMSKSGQSKKAS